MMIFRSLDEISVYVAEEPVSILFGDEQDVVRGQIVPVWNSAVEYGTPMGGIVRSMWGGAEERFLCVPPVRRHEWVF